VNKATVPIIARLKALQNPAHVAAGGARVIADIGHPSPMTALMRELNETILGRTLRLESSSGSGITLDVAGRRVLRLTDAVGVVGAEACLAAGALEDDQKDDLIKLMQAVAAPKNELRVTSLPISQSGEGMSVGLPVALLADLLLVDLNDTPDDAPAPAPRTGRATTPRPMVTEAPEPEPEPQVAEAAPDIAIPQDEGPAEPVAGRSLGTFARALGPTLTAWLIRGGEEDGAQDGPDEMVSHLHGFLEDEVESVLGQLDLVSNTPGGAVCSVLGAALVSGHSVLCARSGKSVLLGVVEGDATQDLLSAWGAAQA
jgi:hypothetical protein